MESNELGDIKVGLEALKTAFATANESLKAMNKELKESLLSRVWLTKNESAAYNLITANHDLGAHPLSTVFYLLSAEPSPDRDNYWRVQSLSNPGTFHEVLIDANDCDCPAARSCNHIRAAKLASRLRFRPAPESEAPDVSGW